MMQVVLTTIEPSKTRQDLSYDAYEYTVSVFCICIRLKMSMLPHEYPSHSFGGPTSSVQRVRAFTTGMQVHSHTYDTAEMPSAKFTYDLSPIQILVSEKHRAW